MKHFITYLWVCGFILVSCSDDPEKASNDRNYAPLQKGLYWIYDIDETIYSEINDDQELQYQLKVEVVDSFLNLENNYTYVLHLSKRDNAVDPWIFSGTKSIRITENGVVEVVDNKSFIRLAFPAYRNREWNANSLNEMDEDIYRIDELGSSFQVSSGVTIKNAVVIDQENELDFLNKDQRTEVYAYNIGLIYKESFIIKYDPSKLGDYIPLEGVEYVQRLVEYGKN